SERLSRQVAIVLAHLRRLVGVAETRHAPGAATGGRSERLSTLALAHRRERGLHGQRGLQWWKHVFDGHAHLRGRQALVRWRRVRRVGTADLHVAVDAAMA